MFENELTYKEITSTTFIPPALSIVSANNFREWWNNANCKGLDPNMFFPDGVGNDVIGQIESVKKICRSCDVANKCLEFARVTNQADGIWGGVDMGKDRRMQELLRITVNRPTRRRARSA